MGNGFPHWAYCLFPSCLLTSPESQSPRLVSPGSWAPSLGMRDGISAWHPLSSVGHWSQHTTETSAASRARERFFFFFWPPVNSDNYQEINLRFSDERYYHQSARYREGCKEGASLAFSPWLQGWLGPDLGQVIWLFSSVKSAQWWLFFQTTLILRWKHP